MILREAAQQALEVLHEIDSPMLVKEIAKVGKAITALRAALAKSEQDPLTEEEIAVAIDTVYPEKPMTAYDKKITRAIDAKLKEKNT